ncbi:hypothetical protein BC835DRAFT_1325090 [Cytidiella melzeri]|nr:hypothetical protein BC835DRAFT_1325090 [Cytidiella melzeri]
MRTSLVFLGMLAATVEAVLVITPSMPITVEPISSDTGASSSPVISLPIPTLSPIPSTFSSASGLPTISSTSFSSVSISRTVPILTSSASESSTTLPSVSPIGPITPSASGSASVGSASGSSVAPSPSTTSSGGSVAVGNLKAGVIAAGLVGVTLALVV